MTNNNDELTIKDARQIANLFSVLNNNTSGNPFVGRRVLVRTYSAGVHIGTLIKADGMECELKDCLRLWKWEGGGLSLSAVATNGIKGGRLNRADKIYLTNCIEFIPISDIAEKTFEKFIED